MIVPTPPLAPLPAPPVVEPEPEPIKLNPASENPKQRPVDQAKAEESNTVEADEFHNDPLIVEALKVFKGRLIS